MIHRLALVEAIVGRGTHVWPWAHICAGAVVGSNCNICERVFIEKGVTIGDRVTVKCGVSLWKGLTVKDDVFIGPGAVFTNDSRPRSRIWIEPEPTTLSRGCSIGANATILAGLTIGKWSLVGAGAVVTRSLLPYSLVVGNPAKMVGHVCVCSKTLNLNHRNITGSASCSCGREYEKKLGLVREVTVHV